MEHRPRESVMALGSKVATSNNPTQHNRPRCKPVAAITAPALFFSTRRIMTTQPPPLSLAQAYAAPSMGWRALPRWFMRCPFWKRLKANHRGVLLTLYDKIASEPVVLDGLQIALQRGQWAISYEGLGKLAGATIQEVRTAIRLALGAGILQHKVLAIKTSTSTLHISLFTWRDFNSYDCTDPAANTSANTPHDIRRNSSVNTCNTQGSNTQGADTRVKTQGEEGASLRSPSPAGLPPDISITGTTSASSIHLLPDGSTSTAEGITALTSGSSSSGTTRTESAREVRPSDPFAGGSPSPTSNKGKRRQALSDDAKLRICSTPQAMFDYLAESNRWYLEGGLMKDVVPGASVSQLAAFWWACVSNARRLAGRPLTLPRFSDLCGRIKNLKATMTQDQVVELMLTTSKNWPLISNALAWMSPPLELNETTLSNAKVREVAARLVRGESIQTSGPSPTANVTCGLHAPVQVFLDRLDFL